MEKLKFKILTEDVEVGESINATQKNIAKGIVKIIKENEHASTIGLQGPWGSGKSTIIKQVKNELDNENDYIYFYFDTWAHEGDLLRKVFLLELIKGIKKTKSIINKDIFEKLFVIKNRILNIPTATLFQILLVLSTLAVPFGTELISNSKEYVIEFNNSIILFQFIICALALFGFTKVSSNDDKIAYQNTILIIFVTFIIIILCFSALFYNEFNVELNSINTSLVVGSIVSLGPIILVFLYLVGLFRHQRIIKGINYEFLNTFINKNTSESSSIDFEQYFKEIINLFPNNKFIIVIDNLDRIDHDDAKKIWSTLQIFLQHRNPASNPESTVLYKNLWIIIPYDHSSLIKIWDLNEPKAKTLENTDNKQPTEEINQIDKLNESFLDKCFQVKIDVPQYTMNNWLDLFDKLLIKSTDMDIKNEELNKIKNIFIQTRKGISDAPSPRELKLFINQFGFLYSMHYSEVSVESICFFVVDRFISKHSLDHIKNEIINDKIGRKSSEFEILKKEYAAMLYNLPPNEAIGIILKDQIDKVIKDKEKQQIDKLIQDHKDEFWYTLDKMVFGKINNFDVLKYHIGSFNSEQIMLFYEKYWEDNNFSKIKYNYLQLLSKDDKKSILDELKFFLIEQSIEKIEFLKFLIRHLTKTNNTDIASIIGHIFTFNFPKIGEMNFEHLCNNILQFEDILVDKSPYYFKTDRIEIAKYFISINDKPGSKFLEYTLIVSLLKFEENAFDKNYYKLLKYCFDNKFIDNTDKGIEFCINNLCEWNKFMEIYNQDKFTFFELLIWLLKVKPNSSKISEFLDNNFPNLNGILTLNNDELNNAEQRNIISIMQLFLISGNSIYFNNNELIKSYSTHDFIIEPISELLKQFYDNSTFKENFWSILNTDSFNLILKLLNPKFDNIGLYKDLDNVLLKISWLKRRPAETEIISKLIKNNKTIEITSSDLIKKLDTVILLCDIEKKYLGMVKKILKSQQYTDEFLSLVQRSSLNTAQKKSNTKLIEIQIENSRKLGMVNILLDSRRYNNIQSTLSSKYSGREYLNLKEKLNDFIKKVD